MSESQTAPYTLSVDARVVTMPVTVRDKKGNLLQELSKEDFTLSEDGRPQEIRYFTLDRDKPMTLGLLVDTSGSQDPFIKKERSASQMFFGTMLNQTRDAAFLVRFDTAVMMLHPATSSPQELRTALERLGEAHPPQPPWVPEGVDPATVWPPRKPPGTLLYDAIAAVCDKVTRKVVGRNALVLLTDGRDNGSTLSLEQAVESAQRSNTVIYSVLYTTESHGSGPTRTRNGELKPSGRQVLETLSSETGGHMYEVTFRQPLEKIYSYIEEEMRMQYTLAYTPANSDAGLGYRRIFLQAKDKSWRIQTRSGYYSVQQNDENLH